MGTWIEILNNDILRQLNLVVPYVGTWIEINCVFHFVIIQPRRSLRGNVDRNADKINALNTKYSVVPYVGTWIEII